MRRLPQTGFTLIEIMIVVVLISILASIALPSYQEHLRSGRRAAAQQLMMGIAQRQEQYFLDSRQYATAFGGGTNGLGMTLPADLSDYYNVPDLTGVNNATLPPSYVISILPKTSSMMANDGMLVITNTTDRWRDLDNNKIYNAATDKSW